MAADDITPLTTRETATLWSLDFDEPTVTFDCGWRRNGVNCDQKASHLFQCRTCLTVSVMTCNTHAATLGRDAISLQFCGHKAVCTNCHTNGDMFDVFSLEPIGA